MFQYRDIIYRQRLGNLSMDLQRTTQNLAQQLKLMMMIRRKSTVAEGGFIE